MLVALNIVSLLPVIKEMSYPLALSGHCTSAKKAKITTLYLNTNIFTIPARF